MRHSSGGAGMPFILPTGSLMPLENADLTSLIWLPHGGIILFMNLGKNYMFTYRLITDDGCVLL